jgi:N-acetylglucosaminyldiphosphoundecaprenol N-acetyl-beta-D-mannosaminyltransferase
MQHAPDAFDVLGVRVDVVQIADVIHHMRQWIDAKGPCRWIAVTGMHGVMVAQDDPAFRNTLQAADLVVPDGISLVWLGRMRGRRLKRRVYGPDLFAAFFGDPVSKETRHFLYGGAPGVAESLASVVARRYPSARVVGTITPPFRSLSSEEEDAVIAQINAAAPDVVWVGLSTPKQELWMQRHRSRLRVPVLVGVGAAFDFISGRVRQAPQWLRDRGLEWLWRLVHEPRRLWRRTVLLGPRFVVQSLAQVFRESLPTRSR